MSAIRFAFVASLLGLAGAVSRGDGPAEAGSGAITLGFVPIESQAPAARIANEPGPGPAQAPCGCACRDRTYIGIDYLGWRMKGAHVPPLVTTGSFTDDPIGALDQPNTMLLFGDEDVGTHWHGGLRLTAGWSLPRNPEVSVEASLFFLGDGAHRFAAASSGFAGSEILARPFFNLNTLEQDAVLVANSTDVAAIQAGDIRITLNQRLLGAELNGRTTVATCRSRDLHLLAGFRFLALDESLDFLVLTQDLPGNVGTSEQITESFGTHNRFYGGQVGATFDSRLGCWRFGAVAKIALGCNHQVVHINGQTVSVDQATGGTTVASGALLAQDTNIGRYAGDDFAVVPEIGLTLGYQINPALQVRFGYNFLYMNRVARPGEQIDLNIGAGHPAFTGVHTTDFWTQGFSLGVEWTF